MLTAVFHLRPMSRGVTAPHLFTADDGGVYVVKFQTNRLGPKVLVNELLAAELGRRWQLCFPESALIYVDPKAVGHHSSLARFEPGLQFASRFLPNCRYLDPVLLRKAVNKSDMAGVMLFDHFFHNVDRTRNPRNILIRREERGWRLYAIDHSHLFYRGRWTPQSLARLETGVSVNRGRAFGDLLAHYLQPADFTAALQRLEATTDADFREVVNMIPREWLPGAEERELLTGWLCRRRGYAASIAAKLCALISPHP
ncbi:MAG: HipA family kinase [Sporomusaceae bacterium]|nr:HipA family kinase [Sporomusaceae bacterium]